MKKRLCALTLAACAWSCVSTGPVSDGGGGQAGSWGTEVECASDGDCAGHDNACATHACIDGSCATTFATRGTPIHDQTDGDCVTFTCWGDGTEYAKIEPTDIIDDGNDCTSDVCELLGPAHHPLASGTACSIGFCDAAGTCIASM